MFLVKIKQHIKKLKKLIIYLFITGFLFSIGAVLFYKYLPVYYTPLMVIRYYQNPKIDRIEHQWLALNKISDQLKIAVISAEDQHFFNHYGFDFQAIKAALQHNKKNKNLRGGSTISQQTAKNVFLWPQRSWLRKGLESWFTLLIEVIWSKERILEAYLNSIEMGEGIFGADAAAKYWFKIDAKHLSKNQSAAIAAILPNPNHYKVTNPSNYIKTRQRWIKKQMRNVSLPLSM